MGETQPMVEVSPVQQKSTMILHEDSSATETNDGMSNMAMLDGNTNAKESLFKFKKVKGFKQKTQKLERKESSKSHLQDEIVFSNLKVLPGDIKGGNKQTTQKRKKTVPVVAEEPAELIFNTDMKISQKLISRLEEMKKFPINNSELSQQYISAKGINLFEELESNLENHSQYFDKNDKDENEDVKFIHGEKFNINEDHDFKEWERYDIATLKNDKKNNKASSIDTKILPKYIQKDLTVGS